MGARNALVLLSLLAVMPLGRAQDASTYALTPAAAEKFIRATQQMVSSGAAPNVQGNVNPANLSNLKAALDGNPAAQQALASAGLTSGEYVAFMGAAMGAMVVGQMEMGGIRGMLPPGMTTRPSQPNIDFMKSNMDLFQRSMQPGASATASAGARPARATTNDEALPLPANAGAVLPSSILARLPRLDAIKRDTDCTLGGLQATVEKEMAQAVALQDGYYGNPADSAWREASDRIAEQQEAAWNACPGIPGGKEPACERQVNADAARKRDAAQRQFLASVSEPFAARVAALKTCTVKREAVVTDAKTANVRGANVKLVLRPLVVAWQQVMFLPAEWSGICESAQRDVVE